MNGSIKKLTVNEQKQPQQQSSRVPRKFPVYKFLNNGEIEEIRKENKIPDNSHDYTKGHQNSASALPILILSVISSRTYQRFIIERNRKIIFKNNKMKV